MRIKGINAAGQALHPPPTAAFRSKPRSIKPYFDCARSVMSEQARPRLSLRLSIKIKRILRNIMSHLSQHKKPFFDKKRIIVRDKKHSKNEERFFCIGKDGIGIMTVRFTLRNGNIRIFGAGYWREGRYKYEKKHNLH